jgi:hypothetical protein
MWTKSSAVPQSSDIGDPPLAHHPPGPDSDAIVADTPSLQRIPDLYGYDQRIDTCPFKEKALRS